MGQLCGRESPSSPFSSPGRTLGSAPVTSTAPKSTLPPQVTSGNRGSGSPASLTTSSTLPASPSQRPDGDAKRQAADAAERRAQAVNSRSGPLGKKLHAERMNAYSVAASEQRLRDIDQSREITSYN